MTYAQIVHLVLAFFMGAAATLAGILSHRAKKDPLPPEEDVILPPAPPVAPKTAPSEPLHPKPKHMNQDHLDTFSTALRNFEGAPGDRNYRNNNPGNFRFSPVGYLAKYGHVGKDPNGFAIFASYELGWEYLQASIMHWVQLHPSWTFYDFFQHYAPPSDNNPTTAYAENVAAHCGVAAGSLLADYLIA